MMEKAQRESKQRRRPEAWIDRPVKLIFISGSSTEYVDGLRRAGKGGTSCP